MKFFTQALLIASAALSVTAMFTPIVARSQHRAIAARVASASPTEAAPVVTVTPRKRVVKRCKAPSSSSSSSSTSAASSSSTSATSSSSTSTTSSSSVATTTTVPAVPENAGAAPPTVTTQATTTTTTDAPPPTATTTTKAAPPPTTTHTTTTTQPPASISAPSSGSDSGVGATGVKRSGQGTWFDTGLGSCGQTNSDSDYIVAVSHILYDEFPGYNQANPNTNPICGKKITASYQGKSVDVTVVDRCTGCDEFSLDFTPTAFQQLAPLGAGRIDITWVFTS